MKSRAENFPKISVKKKNLYISTHLLKILVHDTENDPVEPLMRIHCEMNPHDVVMGKNWHQLISLQAHNCYFTNMQGSPDLGILRILAT